MPQVQRTERNVEKIQHYAGGPTGEKVNEIITISEALPVKDPGAAMRRLIISAVGLGLAAGWARSFFGGEHWVWLSVAFVLWWAVQE